ncbi:MAG: chemotaxis protein CheX [Desulfobacterales bacterium]|jgi:chemotaxis protein CheX
MDVAYINPFLTAAANVLETMIDMPISLGQPALKSKPEPSFEVSSIIGLSGGVTGCVVINLSEALALRMASGLIGEDMSELDEDCTDAVGEIANMIAGNAKTEFPIENCSISVPSVVIGKHRVAYSKGVPIISVPCKTDNGELVIDIAIQVAS